MGYVFGVDGGASKTHALVLDTDARVMGFGRAGTGNHQVRGLRHAVREIERAVGSALREADLAPQQITLGHFCLAGADLPEDYIMLQEAMEATGLARQVVVKNDTMAALRAGLGKSWGVVVICGAGFNAAGRSPRGQEIVLPGLGPISGDWGGGGTLGMESIRLVMRAWDGRGQLTRLTGLVLSALQVPSVEALLAGLYHGRISQRRLLDLVPLVFEAAEAGDQPARELLIKLGREVGVTASTMIRRLSLQEKEVEVVLAGSVFKGKGKLLFETVRRVVRREAAKARIVFPRHEPVVGAALLALEAAGVKVRQRHVTCLESTLPGVLLLQRHRRASRAG